MLFGLFLGNFETESIFIGFVHDSVRSSFGCGGFLFFGGLKDSWAVIYAVQVLLDVLGDSRRQFEAGAWFVSYCCSLFKRKRV